MRVEELSAFYCDIFFNGVLTEPVDRARAGGELEQGRSVLRELRGVRSEAKAEV